MAKLKLIYFDFDGGRGEPARLALSIGGVPFKDDRVPPSECEVSVVQRVFFQRQQDHSGPSSPKPDSEAPLDPSYHWQLVGEAYH